MNPKWQNATIPLTDTKLEMQKSKQKEDHPLFGISTPA
jgi:hypothetical protein